MKLSRLYQPRNPAFWLMMVFNLLSTVLAWIARNYALTTFAALLIAGMAVGNAVLGIRLMLVLMREEPPVAGSARSRDESDSAEF
ncbi:MAG: hypothetical protein K9K30_13985 [Burkholderiaceae bacterium]|nr:hypothetical protein [Burkholderiaceae bacterium]MCF8183382.1 hypothetical protein [Polynucleobacter sp.]